MIAEVILVFLLYTHAHTPTHPPPLDSSCSAALPHTDAKPQSWKVPCTEGASIGVVLLSLTKEHTDGQKAAVKDLNLTFHKGQITALLGPNGAGKTTVM